MKVAVLLSLLVVALGLTESARVPGQGSRPWVKATQGDQIKYTEAAEVDRVGDMPGWGPPEGFEMFSGYVTVDEAAGRKLFYVFVTSTLDPVNDPVLLWLNGGPGCSSLAGGFLSELGPWLPAPGGLELLANPYSWNKAASVLFVESPAFVGFSTSADSRDRVVGDERTAQDLRKFMLGFMERFPHLRGNDLYLSGESYAGHYVPGLALEIVKGNTQATPASHLNLAGLLVGNAWTDTATDNEGAVDFWWHHALISDRTAEGIKALCDFSRIGPLRTPSSTNASTSTPNLTKRDTCTSLVNQAFEELGPINIYEIFADTCPSSVAASTAQAFLHALSLPEESEESEAGGRVGVEAVAAAPAALGAAAAVASAAARRAVHARNAVTGGVRKGMGKDADDIDGDDGGPPEPKYDPCVDDAVDTYFNLPHVQKALHANVSGELPGPWSGCTRKIVYSREDLLSSMLPTWRLLLTAPNGRGDGPLRLMVYSGDVDGIVPVVGTRRWVAGLGLKEAEAWRPWLSGPQQQVGGWVIEYDLPVPSPQPTRTAGAAAQRGIKGAAQAQQQQGGAGAAQQQQEGRVAVGDGAPQGRLVFASVRGAGHMVPYTQPQRALHLLVHFLRGWPL